MLRCTIFLIFLFGCSRQTTSRIVLADSSLDPQNVSLSFQIIDGKKALRIVKDSSIKEVDEPTFVKIQDFQFRNGTIEVKVLSRLLPSAPQIARGFIGLAFRIADNNTKYESIYIRPTNGRANDQVRRNHSIQYYSYPEYKFDRLRREFPERYESYADMQLNEWITMRVEINGSQAKLFLGKQKEPVLIVNDLKHGPDLAGSIGLWVDVGTEGFFRDLKVIHSTIQN